MHSYMYRQMITPCVFKYFYIIILLIIIQVRFGFIFTNINDMFSVFKECEVIFEMNITAIYDFETNRNGDFVLKKLHNL